MRFADTERTRSECARAKARTERTVAALGAKRALKVFELMAPALPAACRASRASSPLRGDRATVTDIERALYAPTRWAPVALIGAAPGTALAEAAVGAATAPSASTSGTTRRVLLRMPAPSREKRAIPTRARCRIPAAGSACPLRERINLRKRLSTSPCPRRQGCTQPPAAGDARSAAP